MEIKKGIGIGDSIAIGNILVLAQSRQKTDFIFLGEEEEWNRYCAAIEQMTKKLKFLYNKAMNEAGEEAAGIFEMHEMLMTDEDFTNLVSDFIRNDHLDATYAVQKAGRQMSDEFEALEDEYMRARAVDFRDIAYQIVTALEGIEDYIPNIEKPVILAAEDLTPSQTIQLDKSKILAFVTHQGSNNSHSAILARSMQIPALFGVEPQPEWNGKSAILDGKSAQLYIDPDATLITEYEAKLKEQENRQEELKELIGKPNVTMDGRSIQIYANSGSLEDLDTVLANDAGGIGLFRTEFVFIQSDHWPNEEEQYSIYKKILQRMNGKKVIFRTIDIGADKQADYCCLPHEENPALGVRGVRLCLKRPELFRTQLRALFRASTYGTMGIMYPMIASLKEVQQIKAFSADVKQQLLREGVSIGNVEEGIMIETPAAALISDILAHEVDFFSIGSNDLTQYTLALDRQNSDLADFFMPHHEAVLRLIQMTAENAHKAGIWCGICGELGSDLILTERFIEMGIDELSVTPSAILLLRRKIREQNKT